MKEVEFYYGYIDENLRVRMGFTHGAIGWELSDYGIMLRSNWYELTK